MLASVVVSLRTLVLAAVAIGVTALFVSNVVSLAGETSPLIWAGALAAAALGAGAFVLLAGRPPAFVERLTGPRRGLLPIVAAGIAVLVIGSTPPEGQLVALAFFAGLLAVPVATWAVRGAR
jgi:hypothetical protein